MATTTSKQQKQKQPQWRDAVAGACAGAFSKTVMAPLERIKLLLQLQDSAKDVAAGKSSWQVAKTVYREQGILSFWRGNVPSVLRTAGTAALNFTMMDYYKRVAVGPLLETAVLARRSTTSSQLERRRRFISSLISGGMAGATATTLLYPIEFSRTRLALDTGKTAATRAYRGMGDVIYSIVRSDGPTGLFQGYGIALAGGIVYRVFYLGGYDAVKGEMILHKKRKLYPDLTDDQLLSSYNPTRDVNLMTWAERILAAQSVSLFAGTACYPLDSVRRRMMMQAGQPMEERLYKNSIHCLRMIIQQEGVNGLFLGLAPNLLRSMGAALILVAFDVVKGWL